MGGYTPTCTYNCCCQTSQKLNQQGIQESITYLSMAAHSFLHCNFFFSHLTLPHLKYLLVLSLLMYFLQRVFTSFSLVKPNFFPFPDVF